MKIMKIILVALTVILMAAPASAGSWPNERDGFMIGFNLGGGNATVRPEGGAEYSEGGAAAAFRLGWAFNNQFVIGLESNAWAGQSDIGTDLTLSTYLLNFTWYPGAKGWFLRAGFGGGTREHSGTFAGQTVSISDSGGGFGLGAGHEWRLTRKFALGMAFDFVAMDLDEEDFDYLNFTVQFNWYF